MNFNGLATHFMLNNILIKLIFSLILFVFNGYALSADNVKIVSLKEIRERGVVMQKWENSCAAASLATVLTYGFHDPVSETQVSAEMLRITDPAIVKKRGGFSLLDMQKYVELHGYRADAFKNLAFADLKVFKAAIVPIDYGGANHYVVFNGMSGENILLADPAFGNREISIENFNKIWMSGIAFVVTTEK